MAPCNLCCSAATNRFEEDAGPLEDIDLRGHSAGPALLKHSNRSTNSAAVQPAASQIPSEANPPKRLSVPIWRILACASSHLLLPRFGGMVNEESADYPWIRRPRR